MDHQALLRDLDRYGVQFAVLHGWDSLARPCLSDLDLVVATKSLPLLEEFLRNSFSIVQTLRYEATGFAFVLRDKNNNGKGCSIIDVTTDYRYGGRIFLSEERLFQARQRRKEFWVVGPDQELSYLLVKKIYEKGSVPESQKVRLRELVESLGSRAQTVAAELFGKVHAERVVDWIGKESWADFDSYMPEMRRVLKRQTVKRDLLNPLRYWSCEIGRLWQRWRHPTGLFVVVLGSDGSGKSTLIRHLERGFPGVFRRTRSFHFRPRLFKGKPSTTITEPHAKLPYARFLSAVKLLFYLTDYIIGSWLKVRPALVRSTLVIFDRYYDDLLVDSRRYRYGGPVWLLRLGRALVPIPDLTLILDVPETQLLQRKTELPLEELRRQRASFRELARGPGRFVLLDGTALTEEVARQATKAVLEVMEDRYAKRRRLWFGSGSGIQKQLLFKGGVIESDHETTKETPANPNL